MSRREELKVETVSGMKLGKDRRTLKIPTLLTSYSSLDPRFSGSNPAGVDGFFQTVTIVSMTSFGRKEKPWVPYRRFTARKRSSNRN